MNFTRIYAIMLRHTFLVIHQIERFSDLLMFPVLSLALWGFLTLYIQKSQSISFAGLFLGGLILWIMFERIATSIGIDFMFDVWEKSVVNILATPISLFEYTFSLVLVSLIKVGISFIAMWIAALIFYGFSIYSLGFYLILFWINLILFGVTMGIFNVSLVIRYGHVVGPLTWIIPFLLQPFSAVFYPVSILPPILQTFAWLLPISHVFEGLRYTLETGMFNSNAFFVSLALNVFYFVLAVLFYSFMFNLAKRKGTLTKL